jgi:hypothetical protein
MTSAWDLVAPRPATLTLLRRAIGSALLGGAFALPFLVAMAAGASATSEAEGAGARAGAEKAEGGGVRLRRAETERAVEVGLAGDSAREGREEEGTRGASLSVGAIWEVELEEVAVEEEEEEKRDLPPTTLRRGGYRTRWSAEDFDRANGRDVRWEFVELELMGTEGERDEDVWLVEVTPFIGEPKGSCLDEEDEGEVLNRSSSIIWEAASMKEGGKAWFERQDSTRRLGECCCCRTESGLGEKKTEGLDRWRLNVLSRPAEENEFDGLEHGEGLGRLEGESGGPLSMSRKAAGAGKMADPRRVERGGWDGGELKA